VNATDLLVLFAELSVSYVGFASIVAAVQSLGGRSWTLLEKLLFRGLIEISLVGLMLSLLPLTLDSAGLAAGVLWVVCSAVSLAVGASAAFLRSRMNRRLLGHQPRVGLFVAIPLASVTFSLNVANIVIWRSSTAYLFVMFIVVLLASAMFLNLVMNLFPLDEQAKPE